MNTEITSLSGSVIQLSLTCIFVCVLNACGGGAISADSASTTTNTATNNATSTATSTTTNSLAAGYKQAKWAAGMTVTYPSECTMKVVASGLPNHALPAYVLAPATGNYRTVVATTPDGLALTLQPDPGTVNPISLTYNICPTKAAVSTVTNMGTIATMISGAALFNPYDGSRNPAMEQNVSYSFNDASGKAQVAAFLDPCNGHYTPAQQSSLYHYHGISTCLTSQVDVANGPSHIIGAALDGFPVYGGRDMQGQVISTAQLDACNGITSPTPEFPNGIYHYVLPEGVLGAKSSMGCYSGTVATQMVAEVQALGICITPNSSINMLIALSRRTTPKAI
jgi:hypothetical protein